MKKKNQFIKNAAILTATSLLLRAIGMYFRIYISSVIGAQGVGLYQMIISVYMLVSGFASSGIVVAVTRLTADELAAGSSSGARSILRKCLTVSLSMGIISAVCVEIFSDMIGRLWISDIRAVPSVRVMALSLPFMSVSCCLRGYFTARRRAGAPSAAQISEQGVRIALSLILIKRLAPLGISSSCMAVMLADAISEGAGCLHISLAYLLDRRRLSRAENLTSAPFCRDGYRKIRDIAAPLTASHYITALLRTVESILVPDCLTRFLLSRETALEQFGMLRGMAMPLILFPAVLLTAFSTLLVPEISEAKALGNERGVQSAVKRSVGLTFSMGIPAAAIFALCRSELAATVYGEPQVGRYLLVLAPLMPLMYVESVTAGLLRGLGEQMSVLRYNVSDSVIRIILIVLLVPRFGMRGFLVVMVASNLLTSLLSLARLLKITKVRFMWLPWLLKPAAASCAGAAAAAFAARGAASLSPLSRLVIESGTACAVCLALLVLLSDNSDPVLPFPRRTAKCTES